MTTTRTKRTIKQRNANMVRIINIDTKTRTIRVSNADGDIKTWRTTESGTHFPIREGESTKEALDKFVEKKRPGYTTLPKGASQIGPVPDNVAERHIKTIKEQQPAKKEPKPAKRDIENIPVSQLTPAERKELWDKEQKHYKEKQKQVEQDLAGKNIKWSKEPDNKPALAGLKQKPAKKESVESISDEYMREINSLRKKAEKARKMGQGKTAMLLDTRADSLAKEMFEKEDSEKDARWAEHEAEMDRASKAREKAAKEQEEADFQAWKKQQKPAKKERNWWRGPREDEDAYFDRREKTFEEARKIDKVSDWYKKAFAGDTEIPKNQSITFDELAKGMLSGKIKDFYETVGVDSSDIREKIFEELSERTGRPYDDFYDAWLHGGKK